MATALAPHPTEEDKDGIPLFAPHEKVYPRAVRGTMRRIKWAVLILCLSLYYIGPWLRWNRGPAYPSQAFLIDMPTRRAYFLGIEIWSHELYYLAGLLIVGAIGLFLVTSLFGRVWCGFTCPQTVWTDLFLWAERLIEGDRTQRIRLDQQPLSLKKIGKKAAKHAAWLVIAAATGGAWVMYFNDAPTLVHDLFTLNASTVQYGFVGLFTATTYLLAGWAREQVCTYMCPWPRFQSAMIDEETYAVTYRDWRGETRGKHRKGDSWEGRGDCIDCRACVAVCPTGIDIRDGLQLECIGCGLCIDACNDIMDKVERPRGLIAFDTYANRTACLKGATPTHHFLRPRTIAYAAILLATLGLMAVALAHRSTLELSVLRERNPLFVRLSDGEIRNGYTVKIENKRGETQVYALRADGLANALLHVAENDQAPIAAETGTTVAVRGDAIGTFRVYLQAPRSETREQPVTLSVRNTESGETASYATTFRGPEH
ncbi:MAG TPA: cytochrome c oxidase accessory protein CcoG [Stellaceae bacterium]|nr:cytochrome c oxidase accessory protein CcoG [Stellaceae bacterium]